MRIASIPALLVLLALAAYAQATPTPTPTPSPTPNPTPTSTPTATPTPTPVPCLHEVCLKLAQIDPPYAYPGWCLKVSATLDADSEQIRQQLPWERPAFDLLLDGQPVGELRFTWEQTNEMIRLPEDIVPGVHRVSVEGGSMIDFEVREPRPPSPPPNGWTEIAVPAWGGNLPFRLSLPPGWEFESSLGYDSYVAWIRGTDGVVLMLDYGDFAGQVIATNDADYSDHEVVWEPIDGHQAQLAWPKEGKDGVTGVSIGSSSGIGMRLNISTYGEHHLTAEQKVTLLTIFRSVHGL